MPNNVLSVPAAPTEAAIYNHRIYSNPASSRSLLNYCRPNTKYFTFRAARGLMRQLYTIEKIITLDPHHQLITPVALGLTKEETGRLQAYLRDTAQLKEQHQHFHFLSTSPADSLPLGTKPARPLLARVYYPEAALRQGGDL